MLAKCSATSTDKRGDSWARRSLLLFYGEESRRVSPSLFLPLLLSLFFRSFVLCSELCQNNTGALSQSAVELSCFGCAPKKIQGDVAVAGGGVRYTFGS